MQGSSAIAFSMSRSSVPCGNSSRFSAIDNLPYSFDTRSLQQLLSKRKVVGNAAGRLEIISNECSALVVSL